VAVRDFDEDGKADVAVTNYGPESQPPSGNASVLWGDGLGGFSAPQVWGEGIATLLVAGDIDGDQHADLVVDQNGVVIYWGGGTRSPAAQQTLTAEGGHGLSLADLDGDTDIDIVANHDGDVEVFLNNGGRAFQSRRFPGVSALNYVVVGQLDGRNAPDLIVTGFWSSLVAFLLSDGAGGFQPPASLPSGTLTAGVALGEFTGDGHTDVVYARRGCFADFETACTNDGVSVLAGDGAGGFVAWADLQAGEGPIEVAVGDLDGDQRDDVVVTNFNNNTVSLYFGQVGGGLTSSPALTAQRGPNGVTLADVNQDGCADIVTANWRSASVSVWLVSGCTSPPLTTPTVTPPSTQTPGPNDCCQAGPFCGPPAGGQCLGGVPMFQASCMGSSGQCMTFTQTHTPSPAATATPTAPRPSPADSDGDGIPNSEDNCRSTPNPDQGDADADRLGDACDNCPSDFNTAQSDGDADGTGDMCDDGAPATFTLKRVQLRATGTGAANGKLVVKGVLDTTELGGVSGLAAAARSGFAVNVTGAGLVPSQIVWFLPCVAASICFGSGPETAGFLRKGATNVFNFKLTARQRAFPAPLNSSGVAVTLSLGAFDRRDQTVSCRVGGRKRSATCRK
jgi:hypothetical protein